ncbi:JmjC domain-containing protein [Amycolatopsis speibonae]|uniref:JmjC domain-containing protein n=1 Tax=Amycolatopsis speibonae TaxID=1450224 RepID=A0ABV7PAK9_9PSEU
MGARLEFVHRSQGFAAHYDVHDVFVLQFAGRKHWKVYAPVHPAPLRDQSWNDHADPVAARAREDAPAIEKILEPGDVMYLPRGWPHSAAALGDVSAHLTIGIHVVTKFAVIEVLTSLVGADERLRASFPLGIGVADPACSNDHIGAVREELIDALKAVPDEEIARHVRNKVWQGNHPEPLAPIAAVTFFLNLGVGDSVRRRDGLSFPRAGPGSGQRLARTPGPPDLPPRATSTALSALPDGSRSADLADAAGDPGEGTAPPAGHCLLIEHPGPRVRLALQESGFDRTNPAISRLTRRFATPPADAIDLRGYPCTGRTRH